MGTWGTGIYSNDVAADLKSTVVSVMRLPLDADELIELLTDAEPSLGDPGSEDHTGCWFVVADQFHKYGIAHEPTLQRVRQYVETGADIDMMRRLGMSPPDLRTRQKMLDKFIVRISGPNPKPFRRRILKKPQVQVTAPGEILAFPIMRGRSANPYFKNWTEEGFTPEAYGAALVERTGHSYGFLAWTCLSMLGSTFAAVPTLDECLDCQLTWAGYGTFSRAHYERMKVAVVAACDLTEAVNRLITTPQEMGYRMSGGPDYVTTNDISVCNMTAVPSGEGRSLSGMGLRAVVDLR